MSLRVRCAALEVSMRAVLLLALLAAAVPSAQTHSASSPSSDRQKASSNARPPHTTAVLRHASAAPEWLAADTGACDECADTCAAKTQACKDGSIKSCYLAAVCLCQCNLDAGGCGSSKEQLQECIDENQKLADELN
jgi:hypothetical protein